MGGAGGYPSRTSACGGEIGGETGAEALSSGEVMDQEEESAAAAGARLAPHGPHQRTRSRELPGGLATGPVEGSSRAIDAWRRPRAVAGPSAPGCAGPAGPRLPTTAARSTGWRSSSRVRAAVSVARVASGA